LCLSSSDPAEFELLVKGASADPKNKCLFIMSQHAVARHCGGNNWLDAGAPQRVRLISHLHELPDLLRFFTVGFQL